MAKPGDKIFRLDPDYATLFDAALERTGMTQQELVRRSVNFVLDQDDLTQAMILGQVHPTDDLVETLIKRLTDRDTRRRGK